jgi:hypothetical protein
VGGNLGNGSKRPLWSVPTNHVTRTRDRHVASSRRWIVGRFCYRLKSCIYLCSNELVHHWYTDCFARSNGIRAPKMRIKVIQTPTTRSIDGIRLDRFERGRLYDVGTTLGALMLSSGWAEPVTDDAPALLVPMRLPQHRKDDPPNVQRVTSHPVPEGVDRAADFNRHRKKRQR